MVHSSLRRAAACRLAATILKTSSSVRHGLLRIAWSPDVAEWMATTAQNSTRHPEVPAPFARASKDARPEWGRRPSRLGATRLAPQGDGHRGCEPDFCQRTR